MERLVDGAFIGAIYFAILVVAILIGVIIVELLKALGIVDWLARVLRLDVRSDDW